MSIIKDKGRAIVPGPWDDEEWRPIPGYEGYEVSDWGRVRSYWKRGAGRGLRLTPKFIGQYPQAGGHLFVGVTNSSTGRRRHLHIAALELEAFVGPRPCGKRALHRNGNPTDNRLDNLYWGTPSENNLDALRHGRHRQVKLSDDDVRLIWGRLVAGDVARKIAAEYGVSGGAIDNIRSGRSWSHVTRHLPGWPLVSPNRHDRQPIRIADEFCGQEEIWALIPQWPAYRVSNLGRIQTRYEQVKGGKAGEWKFGDQWKDRSTFLVKGYLAFSACDGSGHSKMLFVHRVVLKAFACPRPIGMFACHIDGNKLNNHASNLRWDTPRANSLDRVRHRGR